MIEFLSAQRCESGVWDLKALRCGFANLGTRKTARAGRHNLGDRQLPTASYDFLPTLHQLEQV
jgi:hypothetical protein